MNISKHPWPLGLSIVAITCCLTSTTTSAQTWRGLRLAPESRCSPYSADDYRYPQSVELRIIDSLDGIWSPYTGQTFTSRRDTDRARAQRRGTRHLRGHVLLLHGALGRRALARVDRAGQRGGPRGHQGRDGEGEDWGVRARQGGS